MKRWNLVVMVTGESDFWCQKIKSWKKWNFQKLKSEQMFRRSAWNVFKFWYRCLKCVLCIVWPWIEARWKGLVQKKFTRTWNASIWEVENSLSPLNGALCRMSTWSSQSRWVDISVNSRAILLWTQAPKLMLETCLMHRMTMDRIEMERINSNKVNKNLKRTNLINGKVETRWEAPMTIYQNYFWNHRNIYPTTLWGSSTHSA